MASGTRTSRGRRPSGPAGKLTRKQPNSGWELLPWGRENGERKWSFGVSCVSLTNPILLAEFLTRKVTFCANHG